jgi:large subunit ribosomal protein L22
MLDGRKLSQLSQERQLNAESLAEQLLRRGLRGKKAVAAIRNWMKGVHKPIPRRADVERLASALGVDVNDLSLWCASHRYAPVSPRKARLVTQLVTGRPVQEALDLLKFTPKRAASIVEKVLRSAVANADEQEVDLENLYVSEARVDDAGTRIGTKRWIAKDRGRIHPINKRASHIHITVSQD